MDVVGHYRIWTWSVFAHPGFRAMTKVLGLGVERTIWLNSIWRLAMLRLPVQMASSNAVCTQCGCDVEAGYAQLEWNLMNSKYNNAGFQSMVNPGFQCGEVCSNHIEVGKGLWPQLVTVVRVFALIYVTMAVLIFLSSWYLRQKLYWSVKFFTVCSYNCLIVLLCFMETLQNEGIVAVKGKNNVQLHMNMYSRTFLFTILPLKVFLILNKTVST